MKKFFVVFAFLSAMVLMIGCGSGSKKINPNDEPDTGETVTDEDSADSDSQDNSDAVIPDDDILGGNDDSDTTPEEPDSGDTTPDDNDTAPDNGDSEPDEYDDTDSGDTAPEQDTDADTGSIESVEEGIYLGIIGFNDDLTKMDIKRLTDDSKSEFKNFINSLEQLNLTALYWADYSALEMMREYNPVPEKLKKVAMVTFTDGLDNQSLASDDLNPGFNSQTEYANAIHSMIMDENGIHGLPVTAYSIGLKGSDVTDEARFTETLEKLATEENGEEKFVFQVTDMNEVGQLFSDIAASLYSVSTTINVGVYIPGGYDDGQLIRYTFDNVTTATNSNLYIEATYHRSGSSRKLENIKYEGFMEGASTISSTSTGPHGELYFEFNDLKYSNGDPVSQSEIISKSRLWKQTSSGAWDGETEMDMAELPPIIEEDKSSALIMLVLDSTTSLGSDFSRMQNAAKNFVNILVNGTLPACSASSDTPCYDLSSGLTWSARASSTMTWSSAKSYCESYSEGGLSGWHLPTIDELKTLLVWSKGSSCKVSETNNCLTRDGCWTCSSCTEQGKASLTSNDCSTWGSSYSDGRFSKFGEAGYFWSSSTMSGSIDVAWRVNFSYGSLHYGSKADSYNVRCVR